MIDFLAESRAHGSGIAPMEYIELVILPRQGWPRSEQERLSLADRHLLMRLSAYEAQYTKRG
jgi:hypothetical protein